MTTLSRDVIKEHISETNFRSYVVGYDFKKFRYDSLTECLLNKLVDFVFGYHQGILETGYDREILIEAAKSLYKVTQDVNGKHVQIFNKVKSIYVDDDDELDDLVEEKYLKRGEFGELILHLFLRDFMNTHPLISKIYFKDSNGVTVHGFDAVHIGPSMLDEGRYSLYLGESKIYKTGEVGVKELVFDIKSHFKRDFLNEEFVLIGRKRNAYMNLDKIKDGDKLKYEKFLQQKEYWFNELDKVQNSEITMQGLFDSVTIPMLCTYTSDVLGRSDDETTDSFKKELEIETRKLKKIFDNDLQDIEKEFIDTGEPIATKLNFVLILFPVPSKKELVKKLHTKLFHQQNA